jgi:hypothetical protein
MPPRQARWVWGGAVALTVLVCLPLWRHLDLEDLAVVAAPLPVIFALVLGALYRWRRR